MRLSMMPARGRLTRAATSLAIALLTSPFAPVAAGLLPAPAAASPADGIWLPVFPPPARSGTSAFHDVLRNRLIIFGGTKPGSGPAACFNDVWVLPLAEPLVWQKVTPLGTAPPARFAHSMVYDPVRDRLLVMGGYDKSSFKNDVWALSLGGQLSWSALSPTGTPPSVRQGHAAVYDSGSDRMIVFGGQTSGGLNLNDAWSLSLAATPAWAPLAVSGTPPSVRRFATATYDPVRARMLLIGGFGSTYLNDVWALSLSGGPAWAPQSPSGTPPTGRSFHSASYDAGRDEVVLFGGDDGSYRNDTWVLALAGGGAWSQASPAGGPPEARGLHAAVFDAARDRLVVFAGAGASIYGDLWELDRGASPEWHSLLSSGAAPPTGRRFHTTILDAGRNRLVAFGGENSSVAFNETWVLPLEEGAPWAALATTGTPPTARSGHSAILDPLRDRMIVFGGGSNEYEDEVWELTLSDPPTWTQLSPTGTPPMARSGHTAIYDPVRNRMIVFGGANALLVSQVNLNDVWALSLSGTPAWAPLSPAGTAPVARASHGAVYDPVRDRMIVFGGHAGDPTPWALEFTGALRWTHLSPGNAPPARNRQMVAYDSSRDRMLVFGGVPGGFAPTYFRDLWALPLAGGDWTELAPAGEPQARRADGSAVYDAASDRFLVFGGFNYDNFVSTYLGDVWALASAGVLDVGPVHATTLALAPPWPNPARGGAMFRFSLPAAGGARLRVFDVSGRLVRTLVDGDMASGGHTVRWDGRTSAGERARAGIYYSELSSRSERVRRRLVLLD